MEIITPSPENKITPRPLPGKKILTYLPFILTNDKYLYCELLYIYCTILIILLPPPPSFQRSASTGIDHPSSIVHPLKVASIHWSVDTRAAVFYTPGDPDLILDCVCAIERSPVLMNVRRLIHV